MLGVAECFFRAQKSCKGVLTRVSLWYFLRHASRGRDLGAYFPYPKHSSSPLTNVRNGFKSFLSLLTFLLFTQWRVYIFSTLPLQLFVHGARDFPASVPSRYIIFGCCRVANGNGYRTVGAACCLVGVGSW